MISAYLLISVMALELFVAVKLNAKSKRLESGERSLGIRSRWLERRARQIDVRHLRCCAFARLLDMRAQRLGIDHPDSGVRRAEA